jgi:hypothetical protein
MSESVNEPAGPVAGRLEPDRDPTVPGLTVEERRRRVVALVLRIRVETDALLAAMSGVQDEAALDVSGLLPEARWVLLAAAAGQRAAAAEPEPEQEAISAAEWAELREVVVTEREQAEQAHAWRQVAAAVQQQTASDVDLDQLAEQTGTPRAVVDRLVEQLTRGELLVIRDESGQRTAAVVLGADHPLMRALPATPDAN